MADARPLTVEELIGELGELRGYWPTDVRHVVTRLREEEGGHATVVELAREAED